MNIILKLGLVAVLENAAFLCLAELLLIVFILGGISFYIFPASIVH